MSFKIEYNLITVYVRLYKSVGSKNSYSLGISHELSKIAAKEKATEETQAKKAEKDAIAAKVKQEKAETQAQLGRLAPYPETLNKLFSSEPVTSIDTRSDINSDHALSYDNTCNII